ncbi:MAG: RT0821/Lpp0805 family surface protein [Hyphomicrobiales bacterium]
MMNFIQTRYRASSTARQLRNHVVMGIILAFTAGCAVSPDFLGNSSDEIITGSISSSPKPNGVEISDWRKLGSVLNEAAEQDVVGSPVPWENSETGSSGSLMAFAAPSDDRGRCKNFAATLQNIDGIHRYKGEACSFSDNWKINRFELVDKS